MYRTLQDDILNNKKYTNPVTKAINNAVIKPTTITSPAVKSDIIQFNTAKPQTNYDRVQTSSDVMPMKVSSKNFAGNKNAPAPVQKMTAASMNRQVPTNYAGVRDYINNYGQRYGLTDNDIGWVGNKSGVGGNVMLKGSYLATPDIDISGTTYMNQSSLKQAIDNYAKANGLKDMSAQQQAPGEYKSQYSDQIQALLNKLNNQQQFAYNPDTDPSFQAYKQQYTREGDRAMRNTLGNLAALTGGQNNSWATSAAAQAQNNYSQALMDKLPQLAQIAYSQYQNNIANDRNNLAALETADNQDYSKYRNAIADYQNNRNYQNSLQQAIANSKYNNAKLAADTQYKYDTLNADIANNNAKNSITSDKNTDTANYNQLMAALKQYGLENTANYNQGKLTNDANKNIITQNNNNAKNAIDQYNAKTNAQKVANQYEVDKQKNAIAWTKVKNDKTFQTQKIAIDKKYKNGQLTTAQYNAQVDAAYKAAQNRVSQQNANTATKNANTNAKNAQTNSTKANTAATKTTKTTSDTVGPLYQSMMKSKNPTQWLKDNAQYLTNDELKALNSYLSKNSKATKTNKTTKSKTTKKGKKGSSITFNY